LRQVTAPGNYLGSSCRHQKTSKQTSSFRKKTWNSSAPAHCRCRGPLSNCTLSSSHVSGKEHLALTLGDVGNGEPVLARVHSECLTGDALVQQRCDCGAQLESRPAQHCQAEKRGVVFYLRQEGRGIGLLNKVRAYRLQDAGADTVEANHATGFPGRPCGATPIGADAENLGVKGLRLMTNNPRKINALVENGIEVLERVPLVENRNPFNIRYLRTKATKLGHLLPSHDND
jgi:GTP cyclohydrolase II